MIQARYIRIPKAVARRARIREGTGHNHGDHTSRLRLCANTRCGIVEGWNCGMLRRLSRAEQREDVEADKEGKGVVRKRC